MSFSTLHLAEPNLKEDILDYNWTPKPTEPIVNQFLTKQLFLSPFNWSIDQIQD